MSSVTGIKKCPKCGGTMMYDFNCRTQEEYRSCHRCGFMQRWELRRDDSSDLVLTEDGKVIMDYGEELGFGVLRVVYTNGFGATYHFDKPITDDEIERMLSRLQSDGVDKEQSCLVLFDPETGSFTPKFGKIPPDFDEASEEF